MVFDYLTDLDKKRIENYIKRNVNEPIADLDHILRFWNESKSKYLEKIFGDKLIVKQDICFEEGYDELADKIENMFYEAGFSQFESRIRDIFPYGEWGSDERNIYYAVESLFSYKTLIHNKYDESSVTIPLGNGRSYKLQKGCKPMKAIGKIAESYGIDGFEEFRIAHSLCLNTKKLKGELCLSIHPLDYMTMSDNDCGWDSCMSWFEDGEYKQGTVEMMNSPCVVVGYLSNNDFRFSYRENPDEYEEYTWNSKKWRCLFIVDHDFIISVRQYPYTNDNLAAAAVSKIAELMGWGENLKPLMYDYNEHYHATRPPMIIDDEVSVKFNFRCGHMYNDFGAWPHTFLLHPGITGKFEATDYYYSGESECVACGDTPIYGTGDLLCDTCDPKHYCYWCDERFYGDAYYTSDGHCLCEYCYNDHTVTDPITDRVVFEDCTDRVYLATTNDVNKLGSVKNYRCETIDLETCTDSSCANWETYFKIDKFHEVNGRYYVLPCECTDKGLELFYVEDVEEYFKSAED